VRYLHTDALGSLVAETDASKVVTNRYHYLPYGAAFGAVSNGLGYTGAVMEPNGLVYMLARYYDPQLGRFLSTDSVEPDPQTATNFNRYVYASANPYRYIDPDGRFTCEGSDDDCSAITDAIDRLPDAAANSSLTPEQSASLNAVHDFYGPPNVENDVTVKVGDQGSVAGSIGGTTTIGGKTDIGVRLNTVLEPTDNMSNGRFKDRLAALLAHEGAHGVDQRINGMPLDRVTEKAGEIRAATVEAAMFQGLNSSYGPWLWTPEHGPQPNGIERQAEHSTKLWCDRKQGGC
jgi:RHS repeat-associated protein